MPNARDGYTLLQQRRCGTRRRYAPRHSTSSATPVTMPRHTDKASTPNPAWLTRGTKRQINGNAIGHATRASVISSRARAVSPRGEQRRYTATAHHGDRQQAAPEDPIHGEGEQISKGIPQRRAGRFEDEAHRHDQRERSTEHDPLTCRHDGSTHPFWGDSESGRRCRNRCSASVSNNKDPSSLEISWDPARLAITESKKLPPARKIPQSIRPHSSDSWHSRP
jgi:hypothetical protein